MKLNPGLHHNVPLAGLTSWHAGGQAASFFIPENKEHLLAFLQREQPVVSPIWLGLGSNVLISDEGIDTLVIASRELKGLSVCPDGRLYAEAGVSCAKFARFCRENGFPQGAFFAGIPGTMGGALAMNAGAFGWQTWEIVESVEVLNETYDLETRAASSFDVGYRHVAGERYRGFIAGYFDFRNTSSAVDRNQPLLTIAELLKKRNDTQPIGTFNCGSVFKNPPGDHAARLIEACGLKGRRMGGAHVSMKHANFIINDNNASASDILLLIQTIQNEVELTHGIKLEREVRLLGQFKENL